MRRYGRFITDGFVNLMTWVGVGCALGILMVFVP